jgi:subtilisin family serine protease
MKFHPPCARRSVSRSRHLIWPVAAVFFLAVIWSALPRSSAAAVGQQKSVSLAFVPGEILIQFRSSDPKGSDIPNTLSVLTSKYRQVPLRIESLGVDRVVPGLRLARLAPAETLNVLAALNARPDVLFAEPNFIRRKSAIPDDTRYNEMWNLNNTGQNVNGNPGVAGVDVDAQLAWDMTTGSQSIVVGVIDEGIDINHEDLRDNVWTNTAEIAGNSVDDDGNGFVDDLNGWDFVHNDASVFDATGPFPTDETDSHGTHVAGTIGARGNNGRGVTGVNWQTRLMSLKFLGPNGGSTAHFIQALNYAKAMKDLWGSSGGMKGANIRVLNNSFGGTGSSQAELQAISAVGASGILFVAAAGNEDQNNDRYPVYPSNYRLNNLISVAASNASDLKPGFTNFGPATVSMAAPGVGILSTTPGNTYTATEGTSMASPHVTGAAALVLAAFPNLTVQKLRRILMYSGDVLQSQNFYTLLESGRRLNAAKALQAASGADTTAPGAVANLQLSNPFFTTSTLSWVGTGDDGSSGIPAVYEARVADTPLTDPHAFETARSVPVPAPLTPGPISINVDFPWRHPSGNYCVRAVDEAGNTGPISCVAYSVPAHVGDPYSVSETAPEPLSTGGVALQMVGDDVFANVNLPFPLKFFGQTRFFNNITISTNGVIYAGVPPQNDFLNSASALSANGAIAVLWDDLRTDRRPGDDIYLVVPDPNRIIFRWQAVTFDTPTGPTTTRGENPVSFEIELHRDGTIVYRYGDGNQQVLPVVGLGGGAPDSYLVDSHTSEFGLTNLTNANKVTFNLREPQTNLGISGRIIGGNNAGVSGVTVNLGGDRIASTQSAADGSYSFGNLETGRSYVVSPFMQGTNFSPLNRTFNALATNVTNADFFIVLPPNPIDHAQTFVRQHYLDFLNREPDQSGWDYWSGQLTACGSDIACMHLRRIDVSAAFFVEAEFQRTGSVVYRMHRAAFGTWPGSTTRANLTFAKFMADRPLIIEGVPQSTIDFANAFVQRQEFLQAYPTLNFNNAQFVDKLFDTANLTPFTAERQQQIDAMNNAGRTRAQVLLDVIEIQAFKDREYNRAFVLMQYFGYLRRDTDQSGYDFWLNILNTQAPNNYRAMVCAFLTSAEYQQRFGTSVTRTNQDCAQ